MKTTTLLLSAILPIFLFIGCLPDIEQNRAEEAYRIINEKKPELNLSVTDVENYMKSGGGVSPCRYDFNDDGVVNSSDLIRLLSDYGSIFETEHLIEFLSVYGEDYHVDVIPAWNNFIQDFSCNLGWDVFIRKQCDGTVSNLNKDLPYSVEWIHEGEVISSSRDKLDFQNYDNDGNPLKECIGWQPPCNGINEVTMRVYLNGKTYERTALGWVRTNNFPASIPICGNPGQVPNLFSGDFDNLQFCLDCIE